MQKSSVMLANRCPRCDGNLFAEYAGAGDEIEVSCLQCGPRYTLGHTVTEERPLSGGPGQGRRWNRLPACPRLGRRAKQAGE